MVLTQEQLTKAISDGITKSRNELAKQILEALCYSLAVIIFFTALFFLWNGFHHERYGTIMEASPSCFPLKNLHCNIAKEPTTTCLNNLSQEEIEKGKRCYSEIINSEDLCGYQEANNWFEMIKQQNPNYNLILECN